MEIYTEKSKVIAEERKMLEAIKYLTAFKTSLTSLLGELTQEELTKLPTNAKAVIDANLKAKYQFPDAGDKFNLDALGLDPTNVLDELKANVNFWRGYKFDYKDNQYSISNPESYLKKYKHYADTEEKKHVLSLYNDLASAFNALADAGESPDVSGIVDVFSSVYKNAQVKENARTPFIMIDNERLAFKFQSFNSHRRIPKVLSKDVLEQIGVNPIKQIV